MTHLTHDTRGRRFPPADEHAGATLSATFDELREGQTFGSRGRTITETDLVSFSSLTGDWHPQHGDAAWAAASPFGERVAHGMLVLSYAVGLLALDPERVVALRGIRDATFKRPVLIGDTIRVAGRIEKLRALDSSTGLVGCECRILNQDGRLVTRARLDVVWRRENEETGRHEASEHAVLGSPHALRAAFLIGEDDLYPWGPPL
jgi:3-hydroxybutyryl-CoA dehydratase